MFPRVVLFALLALVVVTSTGCVDGTVRFTLLDDGSGSIAIDLGYERTQWPPLFGDPLAGFLTREHLAGFTEPGFVAWSEPVVVETDSTRRWQGEVFFDDVGRVQILGRRDGQVIEALGFAPDPAGGVLEMRPGFLVYVDEPLPLPSPERVGMSDVSLSPALLDAIRQRIRPVIEGLDVTLEIVLPGSVTRAAGFDAFDGDRAWLHVDADRLGAAFAREAAALVDVPPLREDPSFRWDATEAGAPARAETLRARRAHAGAWWNAD